MGRRLSVISYSLGLVESVTALTLQGESHKECHWFCPKPHQDPSQRRYFYTGTQQSLSSDWYITLD